MFTFDPLIIPSVINSEPQCNKSELKHAVGKQTKNMWYNYEAVLQALYATVPPFEDDIHLERICQ